MSRLKVPEARTRAPARARTRSPRATSAAPSDGAAGAEGASPLPGKPSTLAAQAYARIEEMIVKLEMPPGSVISEAEVSAALGIGRTPVREALQRLAREHLVLILPQRGVLVSEIDIKRQLRLLETRREVERLVARSAARRATDAENRRFAELADEFHAAAASADQVRFMRADKAFNDLSLVAARNEFAAGAMGLMHGLSRRFWFMHHRQADDTAVMARLHGDLAAAIARRDGAAAAAALDALIDHTEAFTKVTVSTDY
ncbi:GntR family transcriptional regulator [Piscinibacter sakaiensis]|uniref:Transcriptional regulator, GntR family n=1 Tax=Piscinibacter sakaiensis TaxID=1547922 RepID=A0A0K8NXS8_PISS1|nr:GntR family transcriptional regulator [Piscinibacter sakaiensis]GAP35202.1 transcriptional regulator, GntR family [Piscinibacter sakaiensis]